MMMRKRVVVANSLLRLLRSIAIILDQADVSDAAIQIIDENNEKAHGALR